SRGYDLGELAGGRSSMEAHGNRYGFRGPLPRTGAGSPCPLVRTRLFRLMRSGAAPAAPDVVLPAQAEPLDERTVALDVGLLQVVEQPAAATDQQQQTTTAVVVVLVLLEVLGQVGDPSGQ